MMHGLQKDINEQTYYFSKNSGTMQYGWQIIDNINYYFQPSTGILINT
ncbi:hypothetical protein DRA4_1601 [Lactococcus lactis subsp. lactis bv. diacetylactis]|nr:hypothetical protein DRA4_1601 [Lactococcus lactis subsp. lactis bv. diacetylactis]